MIPNPNPTTSRIKRGMPADELICPKCGACNRPGVAYVWRVLDERGNHCECHVCSHAWSEP